MLNSENLTWRFRTNRCEIIRTTQEYVDPEQWPNYQIFLAEYKASPVIQGFRQHDSNVEQVNTAAKEVFLWLINSNTFSNMFESALKQYEAQRASMGFPAQSLIDSKQDVLKEVAQHIINNVSNLPSHYVISAFWNSTGRTLLSVRTAHEFRPLHQSMDGLLKNSSKLKKWLEAFRLALSRDYDIPAAPVPGISFEG